jgi:hypothetical protein
MRDLSSWLNTSTNDERLTNSKRNVNTPLETSYSFICSRNKYSRASESYYEKFKGFESDIAAIINRKVYKKLKPID